MKQGSICLILLLTVLCAHAQKKETQDKLYPQNYFAAPVHIPLLLAGNYGECRLGHFHSGIDIKTNGKENEPVYAAADGYISRIKMEKGGFGHALYITHPNGYTTLYAHLNDFVPQVQQYLRTIQYQKETWDVDISLTSSQFPVKKGQKIAWSGNTGASTAPHVHFEIRNSKTEHPLNPELFGLKISDKIPPVPKSIAIYDLSRSIYEQLPQIKELKKKGIYYNTIKDTILIDPAVSGIGIQAADYMNASDNTLAFYTATLYMDGIVQNEVVLDNIGYDETRYIHAYADYKTKMDVGSWMQLLFRLPGNNLTRIYKGINSVKGGLVITDNKPHELKIVLKDAFSNSSIIKLYIKSAGKSNPLICEKLFKVNAVNNFEQPDVTFYLDETSIYDDLCFQFDRTEDKKSFSDRFKIHQADIPVHHYFDITIVPNKVVPKVIADKIALVYNDGKNEEGKAAKYDNKNGYSARVRNFGEYRLIADTTAPVIIPLQKGDNLSKVSSISFRITDDITFVKKFRGTIDGKWVCFEQHKDVFFYKFDEHCTKGKHELIVTATDDNGNSAITKYLFTR